MTRDVLAFPKPSRLKDRAYLDWIRRQPCLIDHVAAHAHHTTAVGAGGSDYRAVPLCPKHHMEAHRLGRSRFEERHRLDLNEEVIRLLERYIAARGSE